MSEREYQTERGPQWDKGKGCDTFGPIGPWLVTRDEIANVQRLAMWLDLNGKREQTGNTKTMIFGVAKIVSYVSEFMTLMPGDIITTGTPPGVGMGHKPPLYLKKGDVMTLALKAWVSSVRWWFLSSDDAFGCPVRLAPSECSLQNASCAHIICVIQSPLGSQP